MKLVWWACSLSLILVSSQARAQELSGYGEVPLIASGFPSEAPRENVLTAAILRANAHQQAEDAAAQTQDQLIQTGDSVAPALDPWPGPPEPNTIAYHQDSGNRSYLVSSRAAGSLYAQVDVLFWMQGNRSNDQPLVVDANTGATFLSTSDIDSNFTPGVRATIGGRLCGCLPLEFTYLGLFPGSSSATAVSPGGDAFLIFPGNFFGNVFVGFDSATVTSRSSINGIEANIPPCCVCEPCDNGCDGWRPPTVEWFAGFRYLNLTDRLNIAAQRVVDGGVEQGSYNVRTTNNLYGVQLGARVRRSPRPWGWEATGKAGIFGNDARQTQTVTDFPNFPIRPTVSRSGSGAAFVGEFNLSGLYRLNDVWSLRAGYSVLWVEGVALATDQLDFNFATAPSGDQLDRSGGLFFHGANLGLEAGW